MKNSKYLLIKTNYSKNLYFLIILFALIVLFILFSKNIRVCICVIGKNENKYIREFIEYYKFYGIDQIFLYDNNDINGEFFEEVIFDYISNKYVKIINFRGKKSVQLLSYRDCYKKNYMFFDWFIFFDLDEYIYLKNNFNNIKIYLNNKKFKRCQVIHLNFIYFTDNNLLKYDNRTLKERFPARANYARRGKKKNISLYETKSIIRGKIPNLKIKSLHLGTNSYNICNGFGQKYSGYLQSDFDKYFIIHYFSKSTEEFINKIKRGDAVFGTKIMINIHKYFKYNKITLEKINMFERELKLNLSKYRKRLKKSMSEKF